MFEYTVYRDNSAKEFKRACAVIEQHYPDAKKGELLIDVDGSVVQTYTHQEKDIDIYDDYDIGIVYVKSEIDLSHIFN